MFTNHCYGCGLDDLIGTQNGQVSYVDCQVANCHQRNPYHDRPGKVDVRILDFLGHEIEIVP